MRMTNNDNEVERHIYIYIQMYAFVLPVLLFNAGAWGVCESVIKRIEVFHRKLLRRVLGVR
jgi:hypothetical protein